MSDYSLSLYNGGMFMLANMPVCFGLRRGGGGRGCYKQKKNECKPLQPFSLPNAERIVLKRMIIILFYAFRICLVTLHTNKMYAICMCILANVYSNFLQFLYIHTPCRLFYKNKDKRNLLKFRNTTECSIIL